MARGRIFDEETGQGVGGVLVRLGPEAAVTMRRVASRSRRCAGTLPRERGRHGSSRVSDALLTVMYRSSAPEARRAGRLLAVTRARRPGARRHASVRFRIDARKRVARLVGRRRRISRRDDRAGRARDTIYQVTNQDGVADFRDVPVGRWTVQMVGGSLPEAHALDVEERAVGVKARERASVLLRVVPKRRAVQFIEPPPVIVARPKRGGRVTVPSAPDCT